MTIITKVIHEGSNLSMQILFDLIVVTQYNK